jgi:hypothetical protein
MCLPDGVLLGNDPKSQTWVTAIERKKDFIERRHRDFDLALVRRVRTERGRNGNGTVIVIASME